jgi:hydrogenase maturation protease
LHVFCEEFFVKGLIPFVGVSKPEVIFCAFLAENSFVNALNLFIRVRRMEMHNLNILVLGIGNLLLQDEGAGVRALAEFEGNYETPAGVELIDGGTSGIELLQYIQGKDYLIILDVVKSGKLPGDLIRMEGEEVPALFQKKISPHQLGLSDLLAAVQLTDKMPLGVVLFGIEPKSIDTGLELSDEVGRNLGELADMVARELASLGLDIRRKSGTPEAPDSPELQGVHQTLLTREQKKE